MKKITTTILVIIVLLALIILLDHEHQVEFLDRDIHVLTPIVMLGCGFILTTLRFWE